MIKKQKFKITKTNKSIEDFYVILPISNFLNNSLAVNISESIILATVNDPPTIAHIDVINV